MLTVEIPGGELFDEAKNEFVNTKSCTLQLEHSLVSISKWEAKWSIPFLGKQEKTDKQLLDYVKCMTITQNVPDEVFNAIPPKVLDEITKYINAPMTATTFREEPNSNGRREVITSEIIYYWMISANIPFECQKWHLNRLLTLIRVCKIKNQPQNSKIGKNELLRRNAQLNAARKKKLNTRG